MHLLRKTLMIRDILEDERTDQGEKIDNGFLFDGLAICSCGEEILKICLGTFCEMNDWNGFRKECKQFMKRVAVLSDTHGLLRPEVLEAIVGCDAIIILVRRSGTNG